MTSNTGTSSSNLLNDPFGRRMTYLRVSVTDRCNMRCVYCMPPQGIVKQSHHDILTYEEITRFVEIVARYGINKIRITGGEPLVRPDLPVLVSKLSAFPGIQQINLTTNGLLLAPMAAELKSAGLTRVNLSIDSLQPEKFKRITRGGSLEKVWQAIQAAEESGLTPIKLNVVAMRGINDDEILDLARLAMDHPWHIRFIELMPLVDSLPSAENDLHFSPEDSYIPLKEIRSILAPLNLQPAATENGSGPARMFRIPSGLGLVGFIPPLSGPFCASCNRLRLTADGLLRACLLDDSSVSIREALRAGEDLLPYLRQAVAMKPQGHSLSVKHYPLSGCMRQVGG